MSEDALAVVRDVIKRAREAERTIEVKIDYDGEVETIKRLFRARKEAEALLVRLGGPAAVDVAERLLERSQDWHAIRGGAFVPTEANHGIRGVGWALPWATCEKELCSADREALLTWARQAI